LWVRSRSRKVDVGQKSNFSGIFRRVNIFSRLGHLFYTCSQWSETALSIFFNLFSMFSHKIENAKSSKFKKLKNNHVGSNQTFKFDVFGKSTSSLLRSLFKIKYIELNVTAKFQLFLVDIWPPFLNLEPVFEKWRFFLNSWFRDGKNENFKS